MGRLPSARDREKRGSTGEKERGRTDCLLIRPDNCRWVRGSPCLASPRLSSPRITSTSPSPLPLYPFSSPPFVHLPLLVFRSFPTLTCFSPVFFSSPLDPPLPTDPVEKGINIGRDETGPRYESRSDFIKVISSRDVDAFDSGDRESESMLRIIECVV